MTKLFSILFLSMLILSSCADKNEQALLLNYTDQTQSIHINLDESPNLEALNVTSQKRDGTQVYTPGEILVSTNWGQGWPYNKLLPEIGNSKSVAGCTNTAFAQLVYYHKSPSASKGSIIQKWNNETLSTQLEKSFRLDLIPESLNSNTPEYVKDELASLFFDIGLINLTDFNSSANGGSTAALEIDNIKRYLGYTDIQTYTKNASVLDEEFNEILKSEIIAFRPILLSMNGSLNHMAIIDGFKEENGKLLFHLNFGWDGRENGFYSLDKNLKVKISQSGNVITYGIADEFKIYYNIFPSADKVEDISMLEAGDGVLGSKITGRLTEQDEDFYFNIYLKGRIRFNKNVGNGYFIEILNQRGEILITSDSNIETIIPLGKYTIRVSKFIVNPDGSKTFYRGETGYTINIVNNNLEMQDYEKADQVEDHLFLGIPNHLILSKDFLQKTIRLDAKVIPVEKIKYSATIDENSGLSVEVEDHFLTITKNVESLDVGIFELSISSMNENEKLFETKSVPIIIADREYSFDKQFIIEGIFANQEKVISKDIILDGNCTLRGYNGYSNQAFFISIKKENNDVITPTNNTIESEFEFGKYQLSASLENGSSYYTIKPGVNDNFMISVLCPDANTSKEKLIEIVE